MNLIDRIAKLRELEAAALPAPWKHAIVGDCDHKRILVAIGDARGYTAKDVPDPDACLICDLRNAAPKLLAALDFRAGDAEILADWLYQIEEEYGGDGTDPADQPITKVLRRYQAMAEHMEAESK
jgi:hypothetical protein